LFFFQAEDCIRYFHVTGVQTCALPIFRLMASGPRCGLYEIQLPEMQPGSSIMPGKVNPVMAEVLNQTCFLVMGLDLTVTLAAERSEERRVGEFSSCTCSHLSEIKHERD